MKKILSGILVLCLSLALLSACDRGGQPDTPTSKLSNGKSKGLGNAKNGNAYLSWALTELATFVVRYNPEAKRVYDRYFNRSRLRVKAIRSVAAKIARGIFMMLKNGEVFDMKRCFGG